MQANYFHKGCNKTVRRFYEDFDLLPRSAKELLWYGNNSPDFDDLKVAWEIAGESFSIENLLKLNCFEKERKEAELAAARAKREAKRREKADARRVKWRSGTGHYIWQKVNHVGDKHARLIQIVSDEQAMKLLTTRVETKDVVPAGPTWRRVYVPGPVTKQEEELKFMEFEPKQHICKMLHNSGGK